jgi:ParB-like chromosome segregation protein Spo0J
VDAVSQQKLSVEFLKISSLKPYKWNARTHSKHQIRQIAESIRRFGFRNPVLVDHESEIIAGHGRIEGAVLCGMDVVPVIRIVVV